MNAHLMLFQVVPFPLCEFQSKWIARVLSGQSLLPSAEEMMEDTKAFYSEMEVSGMPKRYTHNIGSSQVNILDVISLANLKVDDASWLLMKANSVTSVLDHIM